ncbi:TnpA transposase [Enterobacter hormaechei]|nr:TnpA transposase [Enterobacter hormaechei]
MPRRSILSATERESLLALPDAKDELIRHYTFNETDLSVIPSASRRRESIGLRCAALLLAIPWHLLGVDEPPFPPLLRMVAAQLKMPVESWSEYGQREQTRREHLGRAANGFWVQALHHGATIASRAYIDRAGLADRQRHRAGERTCRESAAAEHYPARHECHRAQAPRPSPVPTDAFTRR